jgi:hypothetical protein
LWIVLRMLTVLTDVNYNGLILLNYIVCSNFPNH